MPNIEKVLRQHVTLKLECIDRLYLNGYLPMLQTEPGLLGFLLRHRRQPVASPALLGQMTQQFVAAMEVFATRNRIPIVQFVKGQRKEEVAKQHFSRFQAQEGVVFIGTAQEKVTAFRSSKQNRPGWGRPAFHFYRGSVFVKQYYVYLLDRDFGPAFIKFSTYFPFAVRVWVNGHEWLKRQLQRGGIAFEALDNGLLSVGDAERAQSIGDRLDAPRKDLRNFDYLRQIGRNANRRLLQVQRLAHDCALTPRTFEHVVLPSVEDHQRVPGLRFGDPRVMGLLSALCTQIHLPNGFSNAMLRPRVAALLGKSPADYSRNQMTYDLRRLRLKGLIRRVQGTHRYVATLPGRRVALFFSKTYARVLRPGLALLDQRPPQRATSNLTTAWCRFDQALDAFVAEARLAA